MRRRLLSALLLLTVLALLPGLSRGGAPPSNAVAANDALDVVRDTYDDLLDLYYRPLAPRDLLAAAWANLTTSVRGSALPAPPALDTLPDERKAAFAAFAASYQRYVAIIPRGVPPASVAFILGQGMTASLHEQHTAFLLPEVYRSFRSDIGGEAGPGSGMRWTEKAPWIVTALAAGGPAERAGIQIGDLLLTVGGVAASELGLLRFDLGLSGATATFAVDRAGQPLQIAITRARSAFPPLSARLLADGVGYLRLDQFPEPHAVMPDFDRQLDAFDAQNARALILDLRGNGGGALETAQAILGRFLPEDAPAVAQIDERGHMAAGLVEGRMRSVQLPLVVLVDHGSASSSEVTAASLREASRAVVVGQRTKGALATSQILPLPENAALQVAVAQNVTARLHQRVDGVGVAVDVEAADTRTADDYRAGRDPQLEAAVAAIARAPLPPPYRHASGGLARDQLQALLAGYVPDAATVPTNDRLTKVVALDAHDRTLPNEVSGITNRDPVGLVRDLRRRGWLGMHEQNYGLGILLPPRVSLEITLYATPAGATAALSANDSPQILTAIDPPLQIGDGTVAYRGVWLAAGATALVWRRDAAIFAVTYSDAPGNERSDVLVAFVRLVDAAYARHPLPVLPAFAPDPGWNVPGLTRLAVIAALIQALVH